MTGHVLIIDYGSQYTQLIARKIRAAGYYAEIWPAGSPVTEPLAKKPGALILSGGPDSVEAPGAPQLDEALLEAHLPILGICYGMQLLARRLGGELACQTQGGEYGPARLTVTDSPLWAGLGQKTFSVWMSHGDRVKRPPKGFTTIGQTQDLPQAAMAAPDKAIYGLQFHPEVHHTFGGEKILENFLKIAGLSPDWRLDSFVTTTVKAIQEKTQGGRVLCALSGGVDSTVAAVLLAKAVGENLRCVFVDNGLLRHNEAIEVETALKAAFPKLNLTVAKAQKFFLDQLKGVVDPEEKRRIIGKAFIEVFTKEAAKLGPIDFLAQGTLYPDVIESISPHGPSAMIKSHHNVGGLPKDLPFALIEPLRDLFKDEVRALGEELGVPRELLWRQPFPGPGLAIRIVGEVTEPDLAIVRQADLIIREELEKSGLAEDIWQAFAVLLPVKSVGVMGDGRTYQRAVAIRAVTSVDAMTADWARLPDSLLTRWSSRLINEVNGLNRVLYDISTKPPSTIEWE
ncbi:MAG: glutamine-hydrolyzing GMP synthase [Deltaproteobacteria bacterium]|jgi:GMP synthase (glutamine-hydrolysing)|nr:glutamine-hydrolyzing GMP synthase [Deltaproteobacteria bacterium]